MTLELKMHLYPHVDMETATSLLGAGCTQEELDGHLYAINVETLKKRMRAAAERTGKPPVKGMRYDKERREWVGKKRPVRFTEPQVRFILNAHKRGYTPREIWMYMQAQPESKNITLDAVKRRIKLGEGKMRPPRVITPEIVRQLLRGDKE